MKLLVTGGCGFIGSNFVRRVFTTRPGWSIVNFDLLTYAGNPENLVEVASDPRYRFVRGDVADAAAVEAAMGDRPDAIVHFAAESHVDSSIEGPAPFIRTNVGGTLTLLEAARRAGKPRFVQVSTDEVYGALTLEESRQFREEDPLQPNSPYAASKAGADLLGRAFFRTYELPVLITRCSNNYGPYQFPEKFLPLMITRAMEKRPLPIYGDGLYVRDWIHVEDHCDALLAVLEGKPGEVYNIGGGAERRNIDVARLILAHFGLPGSLVEHVADRPGHDRRYAVSNARIQASLGWSPRHGFEDGLSDTIAWYEANKAWWHRITTGDYLSREVRGAPWALMAHRTPDESSRSLRPRCSSCRSARIDHERGSDPAPARGSRWPRPYWPAQRCRAVLATTFHVRPTGTTTVQRSGDAADPVSGETPSPAFQTRSTPSTSPRPGTSSASAGTYTAASATVRSATNIIGIELRDRSSPRRRA